MKTINTLAIVDDDPVFVFLTQKVINSTNLVNTIKVFPNGKAAIEFLSENKDSAEVLPDVIFLDLDMPIMDGWQFLEKFIKLNPTLEKKIAIYIVSSSISPSDIVRAKSINEVSNFIIKPITKDIFIDLFKDQ